MPDDLAPDHEGYACGYRCVKHVDEKLPCGYCGGCSLAEPCKDRHYLSWQGANVRDLKPQHIDGEWYVPVGDLHDALTVLQDTNDWLKRTDRGGTAHQLRIEGLLKEHNRA